VFIPLCPESPIDVGGDNSPSSASTMRLFQPLLVFSLLCKLKIKKEIIPEETTNKKTESERRPDFSLEIYSFFRLGIWDYPPPSQTRRGSRKQQFKRQKTEDTSDSTRRFRGII
jgi:hypothetical protein